uniref:SPOR domain-containing protein n=1 Tax=Lachnospira sp. TaxID=2049031 RepID=UPI003FEF59DA
NDNINNNNRNDYNNSNNSNKNSLSPANTTDSMAVTSYISNGADCGCNYDDNTDNSYTPQPLYRVQTGAYRNKENADRMLNSLLIDGFPAFIIYEDGYYKVQVGAYAHLANAIKMEQRLRRFHYNTYITT